MDRRLRRGTQHSCLLFSTPYFFAARLRAIQHVTRSQIIRTAAQKSAEKTDSGCRLAAHVGTARAQPQVPRMPAASPWQQRRLRKGPRGGAMRSATKESQQN